MNELFLRAELLCWDNEGEGGDEGAGAAADAASAAEAAAVKAAEANAGKTFTQEEVNKFVAERNKTLKVKFETMEKSYETLLAQQNLTNDQRASLETQLEAVRNEMLTKEQRLESEKKKAQAQYEADLGKANEAANKYKTLYESSTIERAVTDAAIKHDAYNPTHFIAHLAPQSKMIEEVDAEGNVTGKLVPRVEWTSVDENGQKHVSNLTPEEAVEKMKDNVIEFGNLFKTNVAAGIGAGTAPGQVSAAGAIDHAKISTSDYMELAKTPEGRKKLGLSR